MGSNVTGTQGGGNTTGGGGGNTTINMPQGLNYNEQLGLQKNLLTTQQTNALALQKKQADFDSTAAKKVGMGGAMGDIAAGAGSIYNALANKGRILDEQTKATREHNIWKNKYSDLDTSNPFSQLENPYEDLTINKQAAEFQAQQEQQGLANTMGAMSGAAGGSGIAALAQAMANQQSQNLQRASADIGRQERENVMTHAQFTARRDETGAVMERKMKREQAETMFGMAQQRKAAADESAKNVQAGLVGGIAQTGAGVAKMFIGSDRKLKKNIKLIGYSPSGLNIYAFEYINKAFGKGIFQGVMSDEIPQHAVARHEGGYDMVDYSKLDVEFKKI